MGYYYNTRSPYDVQLDQGINSGFEGVKKKYEETKPLRGKRATLDVRPIGERSRPWERVIKVSDNEYYLTNNAYTYADMAKLGGQEHRHHTRCITYKLEGDQETIILHARRRTWVDKDANGEYPIDVHGLSAPSNLYFYHFNLPKKVSIVNVRANKFLRLESEEGYKYYTLHQGDVVITRKVTDSFWSPLVVHRIRKHTLDRKKTKELRAKAKDLVAYIKVMMPLVESKWNWGNLIDRYARETNQSFDEVITAKGDDVPEYWYNLAENYKAKVRNYSYETRDYVYSESSLSRHIYNDLYKLAQPFKVEEVPLGIMAHDRYKSWI